MSDPIDFEMARLRKGAAEAINRPEPGFNALSAIETAAIMLGRFGEAAAAHDLMVAHGLWADLLDEASSFACVVANGHDSPTDYDALMTSIGNTGVTL